MMHLESDSAAGRNHDLPTNHSMSYLSLWTRKRLPHIEPGIDEPEYVAEYSEENRKHAGSDYQPLLDHVAGLLDDRGNAEILEIGPGPGWIAIRLAQSHPGVSVTGIDVSPTFVTIANQNKVQQSVQDRVNFLVGDARSMTEFADGSFDIVVSHQSLHYWEPAQQVFNQISRVIRPAGGFVVSDERRDITWRGRLQVMSGLRILSRRIGASWRQSLAGCFTADEVAQILQTSELRDCWEMVRSPRMVLITGNKQERAARND